MAKRRFSARPGRFDGVDVIDIIMQQPATADYIAGKIYRYFVREDLSPELQKQLGAVLRQNHYEIAPLLEKIFLSRDFYSPASVGTQIKGPVELAVIHLQEARADEHSRRSGFQLGHGRAGATALLAADRGRMGARPELDHAGPAAGARQFRARHSVPRHQLPSAGPVYRRRRSSQSRRTHPRRHGHLDRDEGRHARWTRAESNKNADRDEEFNTRYGSFRGSQMAIERVKADSARYGANQSDRGWCWTQNSKNTTQVVDYLIHRFMRVPPGDDTRAEADRFSQQGTGHDGYRRRANLYGGLAAAGSCI